MASDHACRCHARWLLVLCSRAANSVISALTTRSGRGQMICTQRVHQFQTTLRGGVMSSNQRRSDAVFAVDALRRRCTVPATARTSDKPSVDLCFRRRRSSRIRQRTSSTGCVSDGPTTCHQRVAPVADHVLIVLRWSTTHFWRRYIKRT